MGLICKIIDEDLGKAMSEIIFYLSNTSIYECRGCFTKFTGKF